MPKDKTASNSKIIECMKEEFCTYGYAKASLNRISAKVGITTAALYKHFKSKEDMFYFLVKDTLDDFEKLNAQNQKQMTSDIQYDPFSADWTRTFLDFIYSHFEGVRFLICFSEGSRYEDFEEKLIQMEAEGDKAYADFLKAHGKNVREVSDMQWHILSTAYIHLLMEIVRHNMTRAQAEEHVKFVSELLYPGWKNIFGL